MRAERVIFGASVCSVIYIFTIVSYVDCARVFPEVLFSLGALAAHRHLALFFLLKADNK